MPVYTTEVTSSKLTSDNPMHQRFLFPYKIAKDYIYGDLLEIGCGIGRGVDALLPIVKSYTAIDKNIDLINVLSHQFRDATFIFQNVPPLTKIDDCSFDSVLSFQVIEHIKNDKLYVDEIFRVLKPNGKAIIATPNINMSLTRNPWHIREYTEKGLYNLFKDRFNEVVIKGIFGNEKVMNYYNQNKKAVARFKRFDIFNLEYRLPRFMLQFPYDLLNRLNRKLLLNKNIKLVNEMNYTDFYIDDVSEKCFDLFCIVQKK